jgi:hypothetical protein
MSFGSRLQLLGIRLLSIRGLRDSRADCCAICLRTGADLARVAERGGILEPFISAQMSRTFIAASFGL